MKKFNPWFFFTLTFSFLILVRISYAVEGFKYKNRLLESVSDAAEYHQIAINLSQGKGYTKNGGFETYRTPFLPFLLSIFYRFSKTPLTNFFINIILSFFVLYFAYKRFDIKNYLLFSLFFILSPNLNFHSLFPTADFIFGFFLFFLYIFLKENKILYSIFLLSLLPYVKPVALLLPPLIFLYFTFHKKIKDALYLLIVPYLIASIWVFIVYRNTGYAGFSTVIPVNFYTYYVPFSKALKEKIPYSVAREKMSDELLSILPENFSYSELYYGMVKVSLREIKNSLPYFFLTHTLFSLNTLFSPLSIKPLVVYTSGKAIEKPVQQEVFRLVLKGKILEGVRKFVNERIKLLGLKGIMILIFSVLFNTLLLILFFYNLKRNFKNSFLLLLILFPLIFSTGILGEARFRCMFEILMIYFIFSNS